MMASMEHGMRPKYMIFESCSIHNIQVLFVKIVGHFVNEVLFCRNRFSFAC